MQQEIDALIPAIRRVYDDVGPPGHFGYHTKEGKALRCLYDAYNAAIKKYETPGSTWTAVGDHLPDDECTVLLALSDGEIWTGFIDSGVWHYVTADLINADVTHWMHYPEPPIVTSEAPHVRP